MRILFKQAIEKLGVPAFVVVFLFLAYSGFQKHQRLEAEEKQRFVDEVNAREERLNQELQPLIERNKMLDKHSGSPE